MHHHRAVAHHTRLAHHGSGTIGCARVACTPPPIVPQSHLLCPLNVHPPGDATACSAVRGRAWMPQGRGAAAVWALTGCRRCIPRADTLQVACISAAGGVGDERWARCLLGATANATESMGVIDCLRCCGVRAGLVCGHGLTAATPTRNLRVGHLGLDRSRPHPDFEVNWSGCLAPPVGSENSGSGQSGGKYPQRAASVPGQV